MAKRRPSGDGMVRKREDGRWEGRIVVGHKENSDPIFRYVYADTQKELTAKLRNRIDAYRGVDLTEQSKMTLGEWLDRWLEDMAATLRPSTLGHYRCYCENYIKPYLGEKRLTQITPADVQRLYDRLSRQGRIHSENKRGAGLSHGTVHSIHVVFHGAMKGAVRAGLLPDNPTERVPAPKKSEPSQQVLTDGQLERFLAVVQKDTVWRDFFLTELTTGLRRGEICGLRWEDFDEDSGTLKIQRTIHQEKGGGLVPYDTKTDAGTRIILLPPSTAQILRERKDQTMGDWIFPNPIRLEEPTRPSSAYDRMKRLLRDAGLPSIRFHDLRHTFATHALASGVDAKTLSGILGHTKASFTLDTYTHSTGDMQKRASEIVGSFLTDLFGEELKPWEESVKMARAQSA